jgi:hypothetical protein
LEIGNWNLEFGIGSLEFGVWSCELRIANYGLRIGYCELRTTLSALLCALRASAVKKVGDFDLLKDLIFFYMVRPRVVIIILDYFKLKKTK